MASLPTILGGTQALYPVVRTVEFSTGIGIALTAAEQRWRKMTALARFELQYTGIPKSDKDAFAAFFDSQHGAADDGWDLMLGSTTYGNLAFDMAEFSATEQRDAPLLFDFTIKARQTQARGVTTAAQESAFPVLASGARAQLPYTQMRRYAVMRNDNHTGTRYSWNWFDGSTGFPSGALMGWGLDFSCSDADMATIETNFRSQWGRWGKFSFTDPDSGTTYTKVRYDVDVLKITMLELDNNACSIRLLQTN